MRIAALVSIALIAAASAARAQAPHVVTDTGEVAGLTEGDAAVFRGVPYAAPPVGALRWAPPRPAARWPGVRDATQFGAICPQPPGAKRLDPSAAREDCLFLNIWTPAVRAEHPSPVMVWLHGGGYETGAGSDPLYGGQAFARDGVVLVTINYRLGVLGFLAHPALTGAAKPGEPLGSYGIMDQVAALAWVRRNIAAFGGDPGNVTVFGESAGGSAVVTLLATPSARGLFQKAIAESPGFWAYSPSLAEAERAGMQTLAKAGVGASATVTDLRALPLEKLMGLGSDLAAVTDGRFLPIAPREALRTGAAVDVPLIIGTNDDEGSLIAGSDPRETLAGIPAERLAALYGDAPDDGTRARQVFTDWGFTAPSRWVAAREASGQPAWLYRFTYVSARRNPDAKGAGHGSELAYVFEAGGLAQATRDYPRAPDVMVARAMHDCWVAFARAGAPSCPEAAAWKPYDPQADNLLEFGAEPVARSQVRKPQLDYQLTRLGLAP